MSILLTVGVLVLIFVSVIMGLLVLMQRSKDGGAGAAMGGGMAEATFGAETNTVLTKATIRAAIIFFVLAFILYLGYIHDYHHSSAGATAPEFATPATAPALPATTAPVTPVPAVPAPTPAQ